MFLGARQFLPPQGCYGLAQLLGGAMGQRLEGAVGEHRGEGTAQAVGHAEHQIAARLLLEQRGAVGEAALSGAEVDIGPVAQVVGVHCHHQVLGLDAIGTHVLHHRGTHGARYGREVFHAVKAVVEGPLHQIVHHHAAPCRHGVVLAALHTALVGEHHHGALVVANEDHVAAGTEHQVGVGKLRHLVAGFHQQQPAGLHGDAKGVVGLERYVLVLLHSLGPASLRGRRCGAT